MNPFFNDWLAVGCKLVNRNLSMSEWTYLLPEVPYGRTCADLPPAKVHPPDAPAARYSEW